MSANVRAVLSSRILQRAVPPWLVAGYAAPWRNRTQSGRVCRRPGLKSRRGGGTTPLPDASWRPGWPSQRHGQHQRHRPSTRSGVSCLPIAAVDRLPWTGLSGLPRTAGMKRTNRGRRGGSAREGGRRSQLEAFAGVGGVSGGAQVGRANDRPGDRCKGSVARPPSSAIRWDLLCCLAETRADNWDEVVSTPLTERRLRWQPTLRPVGGRVKG